MTNLKLKTAMAALERVSKGEGVEKMNAEQLTTYAKEQLAKAEADPDGGDARIAALTQTVEFATELFKADPSCEVEIEVFTDPPAPNSNEGLAERMGGIEKTLDELKTLLTKQDADQEGPTTEVVSPPPVPEGHDGGTISTNQPQGDDNGPRGEHTKAEGEDGTPGEGDDKPEGDAEPAGDGAPAAAADDADTPAAGSEAEGGDGDDKPEGDGVEKSEDDEDFVWPADLNSESYVDAQRKGLAKSEEHDALRPSWGYDGESVPTG